MNLMTNSIKSAPASECKPKASRYYASHLSERARDYFPEFDLRQVQVRLARTTQRRNAALHEFELTAPGVRRLILAKSPFGQGAHGPRHRKTDSRPRLVPSAPADETGLLEYRALSAIEQRVKQLDDPRFGAIRVLDLLPEPYTLVMEKSEDPSFRQLLTRALRGGGSNCDLGLAFRNTGAWLRQYHHLPPLSHRQSRVEVRADVLDTIERLTDYLRRTRQGTVLLDRMRICLIEAAFALPKRLPLGTGHGDFAPRNVLVGPDSRVTVCDTRARWAAPIYEDLGYLLFTLQTSRLQICTLGMAGNSRRLEDYQAEFVRGYFDDAPVPLRSIRLFEGLVLLDKWAALVHTQHTARGIKKLASSSRLTVFRRYANRYCDRLFHQLEESTL